MSAKALLVHGDELKFDSAFGPRTVTLPGVVTITASGLARIGGKQVCILGDERSVLVQADYMIPGYSPGKGIVKIDMLDVSQQRASIRSGGPVLVQGTKFVASFTPTVLATQTAPPHTPDTAAPSIGAGSFTASQQFVEA